MQQLDTDVALETQIMLVTHLLLKGKKNSQKYELDLFFPLLDIEI